MKAFKSREQLDTFLTEQLVWRRKELHDLKTLVRNKKESTEVRPLIKGGVVLAYSHWEGYVKETSEAYISYVSFCEPKKNEIASNFLALYIIDKVRKSKELSECVEDIISLINIPDGKCPIPKAKDIINSESNLKSEVLEKIMNQIGLDFSFYATKRNFLDQSVLKLRNAIAHGEQKILEIDKYIEIADFVIELMEHYKTLLQDAIDKKMYLRKKSS
ncbi:hypothetical protein EZS27_025631 [termite gut metagenome]|uniref:RiboL-PSP-HEPN domain-containing protein n=1 Tax=termite gut metagenome TaxID=433724 RepID=A0A5J4QT78_9ZZZZ